MSKIELKHIDKFYGKNHILKDVNLTIEDGDFMTLLGPSGCGKTTTLRVVSGLEKPQNGTIHMDGKEIVNAAEAHFAPPSERDLNLVFQSYALWPHMTVRENIAFGLKIKGKSKSYIDDKIKYALKLVNLDGFENRSVDSLSGGQQQRISIARAILKDAPIVVFDEATSYSDIENEHKIQLALQNLLRGKTTIMIAHRLHTIRNADKIVVFQDGKVVEQGTHDELIASGSTYSHMWDTYTRETIGEE